MYESSGWIPACKVIVLYTGAVIGAGFASGQELLQFFIVFGRDGVLGIFLATILFAYLGGLVMLLAVSAGASNYTDLYRIIMGSRVSGIMDGLSLFTLPAGVVVMLAGGGAVFSENLGLPWLMGNLATAIIAAAVISMGLRGVVSASAVLVPLKIAAIVVICVLALVFAKPTAGEYLPAAPSTGARVNWAWSAVLYVSYNMIVPVAVLSSLGKSVPLGAGVAGGVLGGIVLGLAAGLVVITGRCFYPEVPGHEVPLLFIAGSLGSAAKTVLGALIWVAILTTAIAETHGFASRFAESRSIRYKAIGTGLLVLALPVSTLKFSLLVKVLYPLFGYAGLILLASLLFVPPILVLRRKFARTV
ncbi:MAG: YkvI family membrane protein [Desulfocucumaceae bacterium]